MTNTAIVLFCMNEEKTLGRCLERLRAEAEPLGASLYVILNGSTDRSKEILLDQASRWASRVSCYEIRTPDKSNAWNQYTGHLSEGADYHVFTDSHVFVTPGSISALIRTLQANPALNAATGIPGSGRTAAAQIADMKRDGGFHGSLHALSGRFVARIRAAGIRLPLGLYRGDGLIGSMAMHDLDPRGSPWNPDLVAIVEEARWTFTPLRLWRIGDVRRQWRRRIRQARGRYESLAVQNLIYGSALGYRALPDDADAMILAWRQSKFKEAAACDRADPLFSWLARRQIRNEREVPQAALALQPIGYSQG